MRFRFLPSPPLFALQFNVYSATTQDELELSYETGAKEWCGGLFDQVFQTSWKHCVVTVSPFGRTTLAMVPDSPLKLAFKPLNCSVAEKTDLSAPLLMVLAAGLLLFFVAPVFSQSVGFRVSAGGFISVLLSTIVLSFFIFRYALLDMLLSLQPLIHILISLNRFETSFEKDFVLEALRARH